MLYGVANANLHIVMIKQRKTHLIINEWLIHKNVLLWFDTASTISSPLDL